MGKRKRSTTESTPRKPKRRKKSSHKLSLRCSYVPTEENAGPYLVSFPHGPPPPHALDSRKSTMKWSVEGKTSEYETHKRKISAETPKMKYEGVNFGDNASSKYYICIYDKDEDKLKIMPTDHLYRMKQNVKGYKKDIDHEHVKNLSYQESRDILINTFGSRRKQLFTQKFKDNRITNDNSIGIKSIIEKQKETLKEQAIDKEASKTVRADMPPYDPTAEHPSDIFDLKDMLSREEVSFLQKDTEFYDGLSDIALLTPIVASLPECVRDGLLSLVQSSISTRRKKRKCMILLYLRYLVEFYNRVKTMRICKTGDFRNIPKVMAETLLNKFGDKSGSK
eukprot:TRINITY_DN7609_c0_g1_i1.p1 TRINITY_DN7609_c0_g1~~TRINITY_DN7609_c0_g1_i1.p1  ORF type:complete len:337 (-),score=81.30 TRINITY_DN7609_c0_g1_i1:57-1067(-)